ncbi:undecaprenyl-diphosphatase [Halobacillus halophilus]|uniref:Undecaprenyl-diphosphatase n=1 Tax=Halobacillus halophilus (strain ATCC 35676 / DSM 2266 / JCM 20832 / KCTC 3685 / LMG 17431 / NBRC 102448 / NCIMB 2269) TaxID=866895 RepID=I0JL77_HALH3|nr:undecaprenyl-diphosphate phosphatase [Halobacillus halophilus]ASF39021.1 undecaprenyl-diphosphatase [Halobacillus halophilus]CCG44897.1 undecaprenyl pyrophosphate phosphatase [Halobacillus halophilus DSM 2266]
MDFIQVIKVMLLGMFEGLTEFAPVSSTGHMIIVDEMWLHSREFLGYYTANTFKIVIQLGSILAVVITFRHRFIDLLGAGSRVQANSSRLKISHILTGLLPAALLGFLFEDYIDEHLFTVETVIIGLLLGSFFMIFADLYGVRNASLKSVDQITYRQALLIGLMQCFSLWPGFSRSGSTISAGVLVGMNHRSAADFTFIMAVPIMLGASSLSLIDNMEYFTAQALPLFAIGFFSAFVFALITIRFFLKLINRVKLLPFAFYRIGLAAVIAFIYY